MNNVWGRLLKMVWGLLMIVGVYMILVADSLGTNLIVKMAAESLLLFALIMPFSDLWGVLSKDLERMLPWFVWVELIGLELLAILLLL